jgi:hypothetical protein
MPLTSEEKEFLEWWKKREPEHFTHNIINKLMKENEELEQKMAICVSGDIFTISSEIIRLNKENEELRRLAEKVERMVIGWDCIPVSVYKEVYEAWRALKK